MAGQIPVNPGRKRLIAPSVLSADPLNIAGDVEKINGLYDFLHVDVMDGNFVPNISYGPSLVSALRKRYPETVLDVHLMVDTPENFIEPFARSGATYLTVHVEASCHLNRLLSEIRKLGCKPGVTLNPSTPIWMIEPVLHLVDMVLVMSVNPGFGGQRFLPETLDKVTTLCQWRVSSGHEYLIEIDGGISGKNIQKVAAAGADVLVMGNAVFGSEDPEHQLREMRELLKEENLYERQG
jgi:ribulose-phosphate 3-epimerase